VQANVVEPLGLVKKRTLALTSDYLLDVFHIDSLVPRTYDYLLHSFGRIETSDSDNYKTKKPFSSRYKSISDFKMLNHDSQWQLDFLLDLDRKKQNTNRIIKQFTDKNKPPEQVNTAFGLDSTESFKPAKLNFLMAEEKNTMVGIGEDEYGLSFVAARRENVKQTTFSSLHTPSYLNEKPADINTIETLINAKTGLLLKVTTESSVDFHAIGHQSQPTILSDSTSNLTIKFTNYAFIRVDNKSKEIVTHGNLQDYLIPSAIANTEIDVISGEFNTELSKAHTPEESPIQIDVFPELVVLKDFSDSNFSISLTNKTNKPISATIELSDQSNYAIPIKKFHLPQIPAFKTVHQQITLGRYKQTGGADILPLKVKINSSNQIINHGILVSAGPGLMRQFENLSEPVYRIITFDSAFDFAMRDGFVRQVSTSDGSVYSGKTLFHLSDGNSILSPDEGTIETSYTWAVAA